MCCANPNSGKEYFDIVEDVLHKPMLGASCCPVCPKTATSNKEEVTSMQYQMRAGVANFISPGLHFVALQPTVAECHTLRQEHARNLADFQVFKGFVLDRVS